MPLIRLEFDDAKLPAAAALSLSEAVRDIVAHETGIEDVFVYANTAQIKVQVAPVEIFVEMSAAKIRNLDDLFARIEKGLSEWKKNTAFVYPINLTIIPMQWKFKTGI
jgi:hypothetical protein